MTLFAGSDQIFNIHKGPDRFYRIYKGADLIWRAYKINELVYEKTTAGSDTINIIMPGLYRVRLVGGGAGGAFNSSGNSGSEAAGNGGGAFIGTVYLLKGTYSINVGAGGSSAGGLDADVWGGNGGNTSLSLNGTTLLLAGGGKGNHVWWPSGAERSQVSSEPNVIGSSVKVISTDKNASGVWGQIAGTAANSQGGSSLYNGYGKGGNVYNRYSADNGTGGYLSIEFLGETPKTYTFTLNTNPSDATVVLSANGYTQSGKSITVFGGTRVDYTVSKTGYLTRTGYEIISDDITRTVTLTSEPLYYCYTTINGQNTNYLYFTQKPTTDGTYGEYVHFPVTEPAQSSADVSYLMDISVTNATGNSFTANGYNWTRYSAGDLYT